MKQATYKTAVFIFITITLFACDAVKRVSETDYLLTENTVLVNGKKDKSETINNLLYQKPNTSLPLVGTPIRLHIYNLARPNIDSILQERIYNNPEKLKWKTKLLSRKQLDKDVETRRGLNNWLKRTGEAPVIVSEDKSKKSAKRLKDYYINNGWFNVTTNYSINKQENKRADVAYEVETGAPFLIDTITEIIKSPVIDSIYNRNIKRGSLIKSNEQYKTTNFEQERYRITDQLRNSGVYHFEQDYITFEMDTIGKGSKINIDLQIQDRIIRTKDSSKRVPFHIYKIKDVNIVTDYSYENRNKPFQDSAFYKGFKIYSYDKLKYRPKALTDAIFTNPGSIFKDNDRTLTYRHINELRTFKYPNIEYIENENYTLTDTIRLTPLKKFSLGFSADVSQSNIQTVGFSLNPSLLIRNIFRGAETLQLSAIGSIGASKDKNNVDDPFFDINEFGVDLKLTIPRFFFPFNTEKIIPKYMSPSTRISIASTSQTNIGLDKQTFSGKFNYRWQPSRAVTNEVDVFNIQYILNKNTENYFDIYPSSYNTLNDIASIYNKNPTYVDANGDLIKTAVEADFSGADLFALEVILGLTDLTSADNEFQTVNNIITRKDRLTQDNLIISSNYSFTVDNRESLADKDFSIFKGKIELAGNGLRALSKSLDLNQNDQGSYELFNVPFSQYIKTDLTYIKYFNLNESNTLAFRAFAGIGIPLGNSTTIPFSKSYFAGGANDNRAWKPYGLGPGDSNNFNDFNEANFKLAFNLEHRVKLFGAFEGAVFVDAGNIWNVGEFSKAYDFLFNENTSFKGLKSLENIAVGTGFGLRYDFNFFVFRFDVGFKTYDPAYQDQNRWFNDYNFANAVYNIGINYPF